MTQYAKQKSRNYFNSHRQSRLAHGGYWRHDYRYQLEAIGRIMPDRLILNSPFLQIPIHEERMKHLEVLDDRDVQIPMAYLSKDGLCAKVIEEEEEDYRYLGDLLNASLIGLPETDVYFGTNENAYACLPEFLEKCRRENIRLHPHVGEEMMHCWGLYDNCEESKATIREYIELIRGLNPQKQQER